LSENFTGCGKEVDTEEGWGFDGSLVRTRKKGFSTGMPWSTEGGVKENLGGFRVAARYRKRGNNQGKIPKVGRCARDFLGDTLAIMKRKKYSLTQRKRKRGGKKTQRDDLRANGTAIK